MEEYSHGAYNSRKYSLKIHITKEILTSENHKSDYICAPISTDDPWTARLEHLPWVPPTPVQLKIQLSTN